MNQMRKLQLAIEILRALSSCEPVAVREETLRTQVQILVSPTPVVSELREVLTWLENSSLAVAVRGEFGVKWAITDSGKAKLAEWAP